MNKKVTKRFSSFCVFLVICIFICPSSVYCQSQKNFLWRLQSKGNTVYILGSIHLLRKDVYPLSATIENAFDKSDFLAVEANVDQVGQMDMMNLVDKAMYQGGDSIEKHVSVETYAFVRKETERIGLPVEIVRIQKPWLLGLTIESLEFMMAGYDPEYGIDKHFLTKAQGKKKILELESVDYQISLLSGFSDAEQEVFLLYVLKDLDTLTRDVDKLVEAWKSGNARAVEGLMTKSITDEKKFYPIYEKLIITRNRNMVSKIENYLQSKATYFVVVGAGHLTGTKGIIQLLKDRGYSVEQL